MQKVSCAECGKVFENIYAAVGHACNSVPPVVQTYVPTREGLVAVGPTNEEQRQ